MKNDEVTMRFKNVDEDSSVYNFFKEWYELVHSQPDQEYPILTKEQFKMYLDDINAEYNKEDFDKISFPIKLKSINMA
jgi:hypothetical protein